MWPDERISVLVRHPDIADQHVRSEGVQRTQRGAHRGDQGVVPYAVYFALESDLVVVLVVVLVVLHVSRAPAEWQWRRRI